MAERDTRRKVTGLKLGDLEKVMYIDMKQIDRNKKKPLISYVWEPQRQEAPQQPGC